MAPDLSDPFAAFTAPPAKETPAERATRLARERDEQKASDEIDEALKAEASQWRKWNRMVVRVLLLGQAESGKSTTLKNFRMKYARASWKAERTSWRAVVQLNLVQAVVTIMDTLQHELDLSRAFSSGYENSVEIGEQSQLLALRLAPLRQVEIDLKKYLGSGTDEAKGKGQYVTPFDAIDDAVDDAESPPSTSRLTRSKTREFSVNRLQDALAGPQENSGRSFDMTSEVSSTTDMIAICREDIKSLWADDAVKKLLARNRLKLGDSTAMFLDDVDRIATRYYEPSDDDVVRCRLRTLGVQEYKLTLEPEQASSSMMSSQYGREWLMYDVGGARTNRKAWLPFFDNVNAIIFLAPISSFDERLTEDARVNRLEDSFILWKAIVSNQLLKYVTMIVFLNKVDILRRKLKNGTRVNRYLPSFGERTNDAQTFVRYLKDKFKETLVQHSPSSSRPFYIYSTSVIDTKGTAATLTLVRDGILRNHLVNAELV